MSRARPGQSTWADDLHEYTGHIRARLTVYPRSSYTLFGRLFHTELGWVISIVDTSSDKVLWFDESSYCTRLDYAIRDAKKLVYIHRMRDLLQLDIRPVNV